MSDQSKTICYILRHLFPIWNMASVVHKNMFVCTPESICRTPNEFRKMNGRRGGLMIIEWAGRLGSLCLILCSWARHFTLTVPLFRPTGVSWVPAKLDFFENSNDLLEFYNDLNLYEKISMRKRVNARWPYYPVLGILFWNFGVNSRSLSVN